MKYLPKIPNLSKNSILKIVFIHDLIQLYRYFIFVLSFHVGYIRKYYFENSKKQIFCNVFPFNYKIELLINIKIFVEYGK